MEENSSDNTGTSRKGYLSKVKSPGTHNSKSTIAEVSSTAIVKYSAQEVLPYYNKLQQDTNLNVAPSNWLRDGRFSDLNLHKKDPVEFSSFGMAHSFVDSIGDVDVISDAENIKKLLKIPYSAKAEVSLAVHRVGPTLLLDYLDVPALISYASEGSSDTIFPRWLYDFYCEQTGIPKDASFGRKKKNKDQAKLRHIFSKFLHYSVQNDDQDASADATFKTYTEPSSSPLGHTYGEDEGSTLRDTVSGSTVIAKEGSDLFAPVIVEADSQEEPVLPQLQQDSSFQHNVLWEFEDIQMLVGSNLPIFGGGKYPAVSLRLRECGNPINVLTGLDYWLDNLMCNVPEVAMCYHLDGIVQYYDLYKTEEMPNLEGSNFSPKVIKDIAQNILSFMKSNCTREGHTYWLFKATDSDVIKLYDLTSICQQRTDDKTENLFTVPVAMLFYRVAKNMMNQSPLSAGEQSTVRQLLNNCLLLLDNQTYPEIFSSASYLLSDLYSPDDVHALPAINTTDREQEDEKDESSYDANPEDQSEAETTIALKSLDVTKLSTPITQQDDWIKVSKPLPSNVEERCKVALSHIVKGLSCVKKHLSESGPPGDALNSTTDSSSPSEGPFSPSSPSQSPNSGDAVSSSSDPQAVVPTSSKHLHLYKREKTPLFLRRPVRWQVRTAGLLFHKAASVYHSLACTFNSNGKFGRGLKNCKLAFKCLEASQIFGVESDNKRGDQLLISVLFVCGDSYLMLAKCQGNLTVHQEDYQFKSEEDVFISEAAEECISGQGGHSSSVKFVSDVEKNLLKSVSLYDAALQLATTDTTKVELMVNLTRRLGNAKNELGVFYMNKAAAMMDSGAEPSSEERELWKKSFSNFDSGIRTFDITDDSANKALLLSNLGRLMRLCAQAVGGVETKLTGRRGEFTQEERGYFNKASEFYNKALRCLAERKKSPEVWDTVTWELSGSYFSMGTLLQDFAPLSSYAQEQVEQEVTELMMKALRLCEPIVPGSVPHVKPRSLQQLYHRIASIHHRLASLYHNSYRNQAVDHSKKKARSLAELHYSKAVGYFNAALYPCEWIRIHLEQVAMCEYHVTTYGGSAAAIRSLQSALEHLFQTRRALEHLETLKVGKGSEFETAKGDEGSKVQEINWDEIRTLIPILESRLTSVLKELVKANSMLKNKGRSNRDWGGLEMAKQMYSVALRSSSTSEDEDIVKKCQRIAETLKKLQEIKKQTQ